MTVNIVDKSRTRHSHFSVTLLLDAASSLHINVIVISIFKILTLPLRKE